MTTPASPPHNLPAQPTPLIGRGAVLTEAAGLLSSGARLLTVQGPGGVGKTRFAVALAGAVLGRYARGAWFVDLGDERHPDALPGRIARTLGWTLDAADPPGSLCGQLRGGPLLLILDNVESVPGAAPLLGDLLGACPDLTLLVTSRVPLYLRWEWRLPLAPLALPEAPDAEDAADAPAVRLYLERARAAGAGDLTGELAAVARLCARLDGLPLALELAAARAGQVGPGTLLARLERRLALPSAPAPDRPGRHQSLSAAIGASYDLLGPGHRAALRRLAVSGSVTEAAARQVADTDSLGLEALDTLLTLADASLLIPRPGADGETRYGMLEIVRDYAAEHSDAAETALAHRRHAHWCLDHAVELAPRWRSERQVQVLARLDEEQPNFRAALTWALRPDAAPSERVNGVRLVETLWPFWLARGHVVEGRTWLETALGAAEDGPSPPGLLRGAGVLARQQGDLDAAAARAEQALWAARLAADLPQEAAATGDLGVAWALHGDLPRAGDAFEAQREVSARLGDAAGVADALNNLGALALRRGDWDRAEGALSQALTLRRQRGDRRGTAEALVNLGVLACQRADWPQAAEHLTRALDLRRELGDERGAAEALSNLAAARRLSGDPAGAAELGRACLDLRRRLGDLPGAARAQLHLGTALLDLGQLDEVAAALRAAAPPDGGGSAWPDPHRAALLQALAALAVRRRQWTRAALRLGGAQRLWGGGPGAWPAQRAEQDRLTATLRDALGDQALQDALALGHTLTWEALLQDDPAPGPPDAEAAPATDRGVLSTRERDVLRLLVRGWPNKKIAAALHLSDNTVKNHLASVYGKLGVRGRSEAVARALQEGLLD
ncbi:tetratricopeptide repeat protein [Deinococcus planocerae]|uniref:tetratricopeptide repeat protein n=1 Tax=Deinococcus planocerae TaxID=1737569 RepID=UPI000C7F74B2|nr:tetratricopeptide repeat protein [Deinococcus planocerae]